MVPCIGSPSLGGLGPDSTWVKVLEKGLQGASAWFTKLSPKKALQVPLSLPFWNWAKRIVVVDCCCCVCLLCFVNDHMLLVLNAPHLRNVLKLMFLFTDFCYCRHCFSLSQDGEWVAILEPPPNLDDAGSLDYKRCGGGGVFCFFEFSVLLIDPLL